MSEEEATLTLAARRQDQADNDAFREKARAAREAVAARPPGIDQEELVTEPPAELTDHIAQLTQQPFSAGYFNEGWRVMMVDLSRVCSLQQTVHADQATARVQGIADSDLTAITR